MNSQADSPLEFVMHAHQEQRVKAINERRPPPPHHAAPPPGPRPPPRKLSRPLWDSGSSSSLPHAYFS